MSKAIGYVPTIDQKPGRRATTLDDRLAMLMFEAIAAGYELASIVTSCGDEDEAIDLALKKAASEGCTAVFVVGGKSGIRNPDVRRKFEQWCQEVGIEYNW